MSNPQAIELIVGLGNPGANYAKTRHNAGAWFVEALCRQYRVSLKTEPKFNARVGSFIMGNQSQRILISNNYMNHNGQSVGSIAKYYNLPVDKILIAHDELDFPAGEVRLKVDGGHGGHNGLRDIIHHLKSREFKRIRIGIGHPGNKDEVLDYVLSPPSAKENALIQEAIAKALKQLPNILSDWQMAIHRLHSDESVP